MENIQRRLFFDPELNAVQETVASAVEKDPNTFIDTTDKPSEPTTDPIDQWIQRGLTNKKRMTTDPDYRKEIESKIF